MLFSLVYTWIKYKMSPPSIVALNRLFVERDSKHRRITSNLGLTFRNSKWSGYARTNINLDAKNDFIWSLTKVLALLVFSMFLFTGLRYYNNAATLNPFTFLYWFAMDSNLYFQITTISGILCFLQFSVDTLHQKLIATLFSPTTRSGHVFHAAPVPVQIPKRLHKPLLYSLIRHSSSSDTLEKLLQTNSASQSGLTDLHFLRILYRATYLTKLLINPTPIIPLVDSLGRSTSSIVTNLPKFFNNVAKLRKPSLDSIALDYVLFTNTPSPVSLRPCNTLRWNLASTSPTNESSLRSHALAHGLFYLPSFDQARLHSLVSLYPELLQLSSSVEEQTRVIRWDRWLYKYSLLHRSSLKTGFHLNLFKFSLGSGFYNQDTGTRNLWLPSSLGSASMNVDSNYAGLLNTQLYGRFLNLNLTHSLPSLVHFYNKANITPLSFYESSYYWALRRFYRLNSSNTNRLSYKPYTNTINSNLLTTYSSYTTSAASYSLNLTYELSSVVNQSTLSTLGVPVHALQASPTPAHTDPYLAYSSQSFFSKERLELLHNVTANRSSRVSIHNNQEPLDSRLWPNPTSLSPRK